MDKTISYLNNKTWYRLLKVIFGLLILGVILIFNILLIGEGVKKIDNSKTLIYCTYGDKKVLTPKQIDISFSIYQFRAGFDYKLFFEDYNDSYIKSIIKNCYNPENDDYDIFATQKIYEVWGDERLATKRENRSPLTKKEIEYLDEILPKIEATIINSDKSKYVNYTVKLFDIKPIYTYKDFIKYFIIGNLLILLGFEILRRLFYYIVLGSAKPQK